jgi:membrane-bound lytic murein transglycosylase MltF
MKIRHRISELRQSIVAVQSELGKGHITDAQALAAKIDRALEDWSFDLMRIPSDERQSYRSPNAFYHH